MYKNVYELMGWSENFIPTEFGSVGEPFVEWRPVYPRYDMPVAYDKFAVNIDQVNRELWQGFP